MQRRSTWGAGALLLLLSAAPGPGQDAKAPAAQREAMKKLDFLEGQWKGESWTEFVPGQRQAARGTETVRSKLGGLLLTIEGVHRRKTGAKEGGGGGPGRPRLPVSKTGTMCGWSRPAAVRASAR